jgi:dCTP deaminase
VLLLILSNRAIQKALDEGRLIIEPEPLPRHPSTEDATCPYDTTSVDLHLDSQVSVPPTDGPFAFDLRRGRQLAEFIASNSKLVDLEVSNGFNLERGQFVLGKTKERIELPIRPGSPSLAARVEGKSSCARCGILIHFTAPTVHAGWSGPLTLEITNLGPNPFVLHAGQPICQLVVELVDGEPFPNPSQFQGQKTAAGTKT